MQNINPMISQLNQRSNSINQRLPIQQIKTLMNQVKMAQNPQLIFQQLINQNPQFGQILNLMNKSGQSPMAFAQAMAYQNNIDLNDLIRQLQS